VEHSKKNIEAGIAGGSSGTLLVALAENLDPDHWFTSWALILAPWLSLVCAALWKKLVEVYNKWSLKKTINKEIEKARAHIDKILNDPNISDQTKNEVKSAQEDFIKEQVNVLLSNITKKQSQ